MTTYKGYDLLTYNPDREGTGKIRYTRLATAVDPHTGKRRVDDHAGVSIPRQSFRWTAMGLSEIAALRAFIAARKGKAVPFWTPTYSRDLVLSRDISAGDGTLVIKDTGYVKYLFQFISRQYLAIINPDGSYITRQITSAVNNGNGTETLTLDSTISSALTASATLVSFLTFCRLADDDVRMNWQTLELVTTDITFVEIPKETPA